MVKEFLYKGKNLEELKNMSLKELSEIVPSKQRRKIKRGFSDEEKKLVEKIKMKDRVKTHLRTMLILPEMVGRTILIHNGKEFKQIIIQPEMIGHYFGEFSLTRKRSEHSAPGVGATRSSSALSVR
ncbi:30S ribosomal protein S19 [Candidatus Woesearchaeota archaeon]|jgi:small subunit ribosomal protein S19|nr:30S ribosomal protein S19 [Candidatus Woesearchaeota archaeon]|tara:strand:- start:1224 stop:1601 length:378 start_codon:yes stop_codon:yes gene_type:complete